MSTLVLTSIGYINVDNILQDRVEAGAEDLLQTVGGEWIKCTILDRTLIGGGDPATHAKTAVGREERQRWAGAPALTPGFKTAVGRCGPGPGPRQGKRKPPGPGSRGFLPSWLELDVRRPPHRRGDPVLAPGAAPGPRHGRERQGPAAAPEPAACDKPARG